MADLIDFPCTACSRRSTDPEADRPGWASVAAFGDCVAWLSDEPDHPGYLLKERPPEAGGRYRLRVSYPFRAEAGVAFRVMFEPWMIAINGWDDGTESDLARCGLASCLWLDTIDSQDNEAVIIVEVIEFVPLGAIEARFGPGPQPDGPLELSLFDFDADPPLVRGDMTVHVARFQGDGNCFVVCRHDGGLRRVILAGYWDWHEDAVYGGSRVLTDAEWARLAVNRRPDTP